MKLEKTLFILLLLLFLFHIDINCFGGENKTIQVLTDDRKTSQAINPTYLKQVYLKQNKNDDSKILSIAAQTISTASNTISSVNTIFLIGTTIIIIALAIGGLVMQLLIKKQREHYLKEIAQVFDRNDEVREIFVQQVLGNTEFQKFVKKAIENAVQGAAREEARKVLEKYEVQKAKAKVREALDDV